MFARAVARALHMIAAALADWATAQERLADQNTNRAALPHPNQGTLPPA